MLSRHWRIVAGAVVPVLLVATIVGALSRGVLGSAASGENTSSKSLASSFKPGPPNFLHTEGSKIVDSTGKEVRLTGVNWFGMETGTFAPHGLWERNWEDMLDQIAALGYNVIRLPFSNELFDARSLPDGIDFKKNPDLRGLTGIQIMDKIIEGAGRRGLKVILDRHRPDIVKQYELWYTDRYSEQRWIDDWKMLAARYLGNDTVIAADIHNEPRMPATWGSGDPKTDWRLAAEKCGNAILSVNPNWLIIVEGIEAYNGDWYWWGGNLKGVAQYPVRLNVPNRLVYSAHDYGPGVWTQSWFSAPDFPTNMPTVWGKYWGYIVDQNIAPILLGEFGGRRTDTESPEGQWQRALMSYLQDRGMDYTYWAFNANSGDTGGILDEEDTDWKAIDKNKQALLATYQWPRIPTGQPMVVNTAATPDYGTATTRLAKMDGDLRVQYHPDELAGPNGPDPNVAAIRPLIRIVNIGTDPLPLSGLELRYWFSAPNAVGKQQNVKILESSVGTANVNAVVEETNVAGQTHVLKIKIGEGTGTILGRGGTVEIEVQVTKADGSTYNESGDFSYDGKRDPERIGDFALWERIALYDDGKLIWGLEPIPIN